MKEFSLEEMEHIKKDYKTNNVEYEEMLKKAREMTFFDCKTYEKPIAVFVGGQTGAGKGGIDVYSTQEFRKMNVKSTVIDDDQYRMLHPRAREILKKYPTLYTEITGVETATITSSILKEAISKRYNFVFEGTMKNTRILDETMKNMPDCFTKIVRVMATSNLESLLTAFERNEAQIEIVGYGRFTNVLTHNKSYDGVLNTLKVIEESGVPEIIEVLARTENILAPRLVYSSQNKNNRYKSAYEALIEEREKNREEAKKSAMDRLKKILSARNVGEDEKQQRKLLEQEIENMMKEKKTWKN